MKLENKLEQSTSIGELEEIESKIQGKDLGLALTMVSKNLYSNSIGSFIRELTSNAVDANIQAGTTNPVKVTCYQKEEQWYFSVQDEGIGMSKSTFNEIYMSWFNSDKRADNTTIGGWGLGSKSPLSYKDSFEIITIYDNIEYQYILINEQPLPKATLLNEQLTDKRNGTTIIVEIKEVDIYKIYTEAKLQLSYFNNVYFKHEKYYYDNNFKIYETDYFKIRDIERPFNEIHLCLGEVTYTINWNIIDIDIIYLPFALTFKVGELPVTLSREEIDYSKESTKINIINKINKLKEYVIKSYSKQLKINDLFKYVDMLRYETFPKFIIQDIEVTIPESFKITPIFNPINKKINKNTINNIFELYSIRRIKNGKAIKDSYISFNSLTSYDTYILKGSLNYYDSLVAGNCIIIKRIKLTREKIYKIAKPLGLIKKGKSNELVKEAFIYINIIIKEVDKAINNKFNIYDGLASDDFIREEKEKALQNYIDAKENITYYNLKNNTKKVKLKKLIENTNFIFYINKKNNREKIFNYNELYNALPYYFKNKSKFLIIAPTTVIRIKKIKNVFNIEDIFKAKSLTNFFYKIKLQYKIYKEIDPFTLLFQYSNFYNMLYNKVYNKYSKNTLSFDFMIYDFIEDKNYNINLYTYFKKEIENIRLNKNYIQLINEDYIDICIAYINKMKVLSYLAYNCPHNYKVQVIKTIKQTKLKNKYYKTKQNEEKSS